MNWIDVTKKWMQVFLHRTGARIRATLKPIPVIGPLAHCSVKHHQAALKEFATAMLFGTATFWLTAVLLKGFHAHKDLGYGDTFVMTINQGQLFIFAVSLLGPIVLTTADDPEKSNKFPGRLSHLSVLMILSIAASSFYAFELASRQPQAAELFNKAFLFNASLAIALTVVVMRYLTIVYRKSTHEPDSQQRMVDVHEQFATAFDEEVAK